MHGLAEAKTVMPRRSVHFAGRRQNRGTERQGGDPPPPPPPHTHTQMLADTLFLFKSGPSHYHSPLPPNFQTILRPCALYTYFLSKSDQWCFFVGSFINVCDNEFWPLSRHSINSSHSLKTTIVWDVLPTKDEDWEWLTSFRSWNLSKVTRNYQNNDIENRRSNDISCYKRLCFFFLLTKLLSKNHLPIHFFLGL